MKYYKNSNFFQDQYFRQAHFRYQINKARKAGKEVLINEIRKINNCRYARDLKKEYRLIDIMRYFWPEFKEKFIDKLSRPFLIETIERFLSCQDFDNGYLFYECPNCDNFHMIGFTCKSRLCPTCGNKYRNQRSLKISEKLYNIPHRQFVFAIPKDLRIYFKQHREMLSLLFQSVNEAFNQLLKNHAPLKYKQEKRRLGLICFIHTFGRDLKWHPHIHALVAERYSNNLNQFKKFSYFHFDYLRVAFKNILLNKIKFHYKIYYPLQAKEMTSFLNKLSKQYKDGFYVYGPENNICSSLKDAKSVTNYIVRYASHPPISQKRITTLDYVNRTITWFYDPHEDDDVQDESKKLGRQFITEDVFEFMKKIFYHIPDKWFPQIRYYGFYSNKFKNKLSFNKLFSIDELYKMKENTMWIQDLINSYGYSPILCFCGFEMTINYELSFYPERNSLYEKLQI